MIKIPEKFYAGFQRRDLNNKTNDKNGYYHIAYLVTDNTLKSWHSWKNNNIPTMEIINTPRTEYRIYGSTQRSSDWFGSGRNMVYIEHPDGFVFEISVENLIGIHNHLDTINGEFQGELILGKSGKNLILLPVISDEYKQILKDIEFSNKKSINPKNLNLGDTFYDKNSGKYTYLGKYNYLSSKYLGRNTGYIYEYTLKSHYFYKDDNNNILIKSAISIKDIEPAKVILTENDCKDIIIKYVIPYKLEYVFFDDSKPVIKTKKSYHNVKIKQLKENVWVSYNVDRGSYFNSGTEEYF